MNPLQLIMIAIEGISLLTNNPALGGGSNLKLVEASQLLGFLGELVARGEEGYEDLKEFALSIKAMADENRSPTPNEWSTMKARSDAAHDVIQEARRRAEAEEAANNSSTEDEVNVSELSDDDLVAKAEELNVDMSQAGSRESLEALVTAALEQQE